MIGQQDTNYHKHTVNLPDTSQSSEGVIPTLPGVGGEGPNLESLPGVGGGGPNLESLPGGGGGACLIILSCMEGVEEEQTNYHI